MAKKVKEDFTADFFPALADLEKATKISKEVMLEALESGLVSAYKKEFGESRTIAVRLNEEKGTIKVYAHRLIVEEVEDEASQISLEEALEIKENAQVGEVIVEDITPKDFSRIAAQTARQVVMQRLNDAKKEYILNEMNEKQGEIVGAIVRRKEGNNVYVEISGTQMEGVMMQVDQVPTETYNLNDMIKVYVKKIRETLKGAQVIVSRSAAGFVRRLFELEVPEIKAGLVKSQVASVKQASAQRSLSTAKIPTWTQWAHASATRVSVSTKSSKNLAVKRSTLLNTAQILLNISHAHSLLHKCLWFQSMKKKSTQESSSATKNSASQSAETVKMHVLLQNSLAGR